MGVPKQGLASASELAAMDTEAHATAADSGQERLEILGYRQELHRKFSMYTSFASSLVLMANTSGITGAPQCLNVPVMPYQCLRLQYEDPLGAALTPIALLLSISAFAHLIILSGSCIPVEASTISTGSN